MEIKMTVESNYQSDAGGGGFYHERPEAQEIELSDERALFEAVWFLWVVKGVQPGLSYSQESGSFIINDPIDGVIPSVDATTVRGWILNYLVRELRVVPSLEFINKVYDYALLYAAAEGWKFVVCPARDEALSCAPVNKLVQRMNFDFFSDKRIDEDHHLYSKLHP